MSAWTLLNPYELQGKIQVTSFKLTQPQAVGTIWGINQWMKNLVFFLFLCNSVFSDKLKKESERRKGKEREGGCEGERERNRAREKKRCVAEGTSVISEHGDTQF